MTRIPWTRWTQPRIARSPGVPGPQDWLTEPLTRVEWTALLAQSSSRGPTPALGTSCGPTRAERATEWISVSFVLFRNKRLTKYQILLLQEIIISKFSLFNGNLNPLKVLIRVLRPAFSLLKWSVLQDKSHRLDSRSSSLSITYRLHLRLSNICHPKLVLSSKTSKVLIHFFIYKLEKEIISIFNSVD